MEKDKKKTTSIAIDDCLKAIIVSESKKEKRSFNSMVNILLEEALNVRKEK